MGNVKKSKGLKTLLEAFDKLNSKLKLYIVGDYSSFRNKDSELDKFLDNKNVMFTGRISDGELVEKVKKAKFLIQPSFYEGFGSTPLEAINLGTRPIISSIEVFKEVYNESGAIFFNTGDSSDLTKKIEESDYHFSPDLDKLNEKYSYKNYSKIIYDSLTKK